MDVSISHSFGASARYYIVSSPMHATTVHHAVVRVCEQCILSGGVLPFARGHRLWGICMGVHFSPATNETPMLSISLLSVTSLPREMNDGNIGMIPREGLQPCHIYSTLEGSSAFTHLTDCVLASGNKG